MRSATSFIFPLLFCLFYPAGVTFAQPVWSPQVRAQREAKWMHDSLHITDGQAARINVISLDYYQNMDKAGQAPKQNEKDKRQQQLMHKKDTDMKAILDRAQYQKYCKREKMLRKQAKVQYRGTHQPL